MDDWREQIESVIKREDDAWNAADPAAFSLLLADDCVFTDVFGTVSQGRMPIVERMTNLLRGMYRGSSLTQKMEAARLLTPDVITAETKATISRHPRPDGFHFRVTQVSVLKCGSWHVASFHMITDPLSSRGASVSEMAGHF